MKDELTAKDFWLFLKANIKLVLLSALSLLIILWAVLLFNFFFTGSPQTEEQSNEEAEMEEDVTSADFDLLAEVPFDLLNTREVTFLQDYVEENAYRFMFFVENSSGDPIGNLNMMRAIFRHENVVSSIEDRIGEELTPDPMISINVISYADSGLYELQLGRGTREDSKELAEVMHELLVSEEIPVMSQFNVSMFEEEPIALREFVDENEIDETIVVERDNMELIRNLILYTVIGVIGGLTLGFFIAFIRVYLSPVISSLFNYEKDFTDKIVRLNRLKGSEEERIQKAHQNIAYPERHKKLVLVSERTRPYVEGILNGLSSDTNVTVLSDFTEVTADSEFDEVILLSKVNQTTRQWYNEQRLQLNGYDLPVKIIQT